MMRAPTSKNEENCTKNGHFTSEDAARRLVAELSNRVVKAAGQGCQWRPVDSFWPVTTFNPDVHGDKDGQEMSSDDKLQM
jgi:hypothetical protein